MYCYNYQNCSTSDALKRVVIDFYNSEEITLAKYVLWDNFDTSLLGEFKKRQGSQNRSKQDFEVSDILTALKKIDNENLDILVDFVASDLRLLVHFKSAVDNGFIQFYCPLKD